jgi:hypothetical protein
VLVTNYDSYPGVGGVGVVSVHAGAELHATSRARYTRLFSDERTGRCVFCGRAWQAGSSLLIRRAMGDARARNKTLQDATAASSLAVMRGLAPRASTWSPGLMDEDCIPEVLEPNDQVTSCPACIASTGHVSPALRRP